MNIAPFGKNLESACKAGFYRDYRKLLLAAEQAAGVANELPIGSTEWKVAVAKFAEIENQRAAMVDLYNKIEGLS